MPTGPAGTRDRWFESAFLQRRVFELSVPLCGNRMVAGDPQWNNAAQRMQQGIPVGPGLLNQIRQIAQACAAAWLLD